MVVLQQRRDRRVAVAVVAQEVHRPASSGPAVWVIDGDGDGDDDGDQ